MCSSDLGPGCVGVLADDPHALRGEQDGQRAHPGAGCERPLGVGAVVDDLRAVLVAHHDVGAGGISNALPELVNDGGRGGHFDLRKLPNDEPGMSPLEIWCNESQERYVLAIPADRLELFTRLCQRERAPLAVVGEATEKKDLVVADPHFANTPIDLPLEVLLGKPPRMHRQETTLRRPLAPLSLSSSVSLQDAIHRVLVHPAVADKTFLISIGDCTLGGLIADRKSTRLNSSH